MPHEREGYEQFSDPTPIGGRSSTQQLKQDTEETKEQVGRVAADVKETAKEKAAQATEKATEVADQAREKTAEGAQSAADTIREQTTGKGGIQETVGTTAADTMDKTATYLREHDTQAMLNDLETYIREHPTQAVIGAVAVGFVVGRILR
jgi:ElaB/YqjD/DUF883 family membrane-anchored ribosome-binding protein